MCRLKDELAGGQLATWCARGNRDDMTSMTPSCFQPVLLFQCVAALLQPAAARHYAFKLLDT